jgi:hypothetical protein
MWQHWVFLVIKLPWNHLGFAAELPHKIFLPPHTESQNKKAAAFVLDTDATEEWRLQRIECDSVCCV